MFSSRFSALKQNPQAYSPFPSDKPAWDSLPSEARAFLVEKGDAALELPWQELTACDYLDFTRTGTRVFFEKKYFARRHLLNDLVMAEMADRQQKYLDAIVNGVWSICEESGWQLPSHNAYIRDTPQLPLPDPDRPVLDLFACETAAQIVLVYHLLKEELEARAPGITSRILNEINHRIITPYLNEHFWWMGNGDEPMCNWTPWCTQNVLLAAALTPQSDETRLLICKKAAYSLDCFLKDYDEDGCCDEGAKYYGHAALCLYVSMEALNGMTNGFFDVLYKEPKICNIADFIRQVHVHENYYINFADCPALLEPPGVLAYLFGKRTDNPHLSAFAAEGIQGAGCFKPSADLSLYTRLATIFASEEISTHTAKPEPPEDRYFDGVGIFIARDERFCLAVKTGDNDDNHNHNDTGSIILYTNGKPFLVDAGVGEYTRDTFSSRRYSIWTMQSAYHNLPTFAGIMQEPGADYKATNINHSFGGDEASVSFDISGAYPKKAGVLQYLRTVCLKKGKGVFITDTYSGAHPATLSLMLDSRPVINGNSIQVPSRGQITVQGADSIVMEHISVTDSILQKVWSDSLYRLLIAFSHKLDLTIF